MPASDNSTFEPIANPYIVGNPIEDRKMFFGREDDFEYIRKKVTGGKEGGLLVLCGTRRSGKTSILFQIKRGRLGDDFLPILIDMQSMTVQDDAEFLAKLAQEIIAALESPDISYERDYLDLAGENPFTAFQSLIQVINTKLKGRKLVLMFDEYELFETHIDKARFSTDILNLLANWMEHRHGVFMIFTGSDKLEGRNKQYWGSFLGKALHRRISFLSRSDTLRLVNDPLSGVVSYAKGIPEAIYKLTAGQPFYSQVICQSIVDHLNEAERYDVDAADIETVVKEIIDNPLPQMIFSWSSLSPIEKMSLSSLAEISKKVAGPIAIPDVLSYPKQEKLGYKFDQGRLKEAFERLFGDDLLDKDKKGECYAFKMDLWRKWIQRMHSIWQVIDEIGGGEGAEIGNGILKAGPDSSKGRFVRLGLIIFVGVAMATAAAIVAYRSFLSEEVPRMGAGVAETAPVDSTMLTIGTDPPGARVFLDGRPLQLTPSGKTKVAATKATLEIRMRGYRPVLETVELKSDEPFERDYVLKELTGSLYVTSSPGGATIYLDGSATGKTTPDTLTSLVASGSYRIELRLQSYHAATYQNERVTPESVRALHHDFQVKTYPLIVSTEPDGAKVVVDGGSPQDSPASFSSLSEGSHTLVIRKEGYEAARRNVTVPTDQNRVHIALSPLPPGSIEFQIIPIADIYINGTLEKKDGVNYRVELPPGTYRIKLVRGSDEWSTEVTVKSEQQETVKKDFTAGGN